jgi:hypothetical protein
MNAPRQDMPFICEDTVYSISGGGSPNGMSASECCKVLRVTKGECAGTCAGADPGQAAGVGAANRDEG